MYYQRLVLCPASIINHLLVMHRWFDIAAAEADLGFAPIIAYEEGWLFTRSPGQTATLQSESAVVPGRPS